MGINISAISTLSEVTLLIALTLLLRIYFVAEFGFYCFQENDQKKTRIVLFSAEQIEIPDDQTFTIKLNYSSTAPSISVYCGPWINTQKTTFDSTNRTLTLATRGFASGGAVNIDIKSQSPVEIISITRRSESGITGLERPVSRFSATRQSRARTAFAVIIGVSLCVGIYSAFAQAIFPNFFSNYESIKLDRVVDVILLCFPLLAAVEFLSSRIGNIAPARATTCGYQNELIVTKQGGSK